MPDAPVHLVDSLEEANAFMDWVDTRMAEKVAVDTETTGFDFRSRIRTIQLGDRNEGWVIPFERGGWGGIVREAWDKIRRARPTVYMHNFCYDQKMLEKEGLLLPDDIIVDTRILAHIHDPSGRTGLKPVSDKLVSGSASIGQHKLHDRMKKERKTWADVPIEWVEYWFYAGLDTVITARLGDVLEPLVMPQFEKVYELEHQAQVILRRMEQRGIRVDLDYCERMSKELVEQAADLGKKAKEQWGIDNLGSTQQVAPVLQEQGWEPTEFTDGGKPSLNRHVLAEASTRFPLAAATVEYKHLLKMAGRSYLGGYHELVDDYGYVHPSVNPLGARTGRMSVSTPALQTLHRDALVRDAFIPSEGCWLYSADYDQQEVRLTASISRDPRYVDIVNTSRDLHTTTAAQIYGISEDEVTKPIRQRTKNVVYAKLYGAGPPKFAHTAGITVPEAREFMSLFDRTFPAVAQMMEQIVGQVDPVTRKRVGKGIAERRYFEEGTAYVKSPLTGRHHKLADYECKTYVDGDGITWLDAPLYKLVNYLIQGTGAEVMKRALVNAERAGIDQHIAMVVHDEIIWDVSKEFSDEVERMIPEVMEDHTSFACPLTVGCERLERWGDKYAHTRGAHDVEKEIDFDALNPVD